MKHTLEFGKKPYVSAELTKKSAHTYVLKCEYMERERDFEYCPDHLHFGDWMEEEQIDEMVIHFYDEIESWTEDVDAMIASDADAEAVEIEQTNQWLFEHER